MTEPRVLPQPEVLAQLTFNRAPVVGVVQPAGVIGEPASQVAAARRVGAKIAVVVFKQEGGIQRAERDILILGISPTPQANSKSNGPEPKPSA